MCIYVRLSQSHLPTLSIRVTAVTLLADFSRGIAEQNNASSYASDYDTYLVLRTVRLEDFQSSAEVENEQKNLMHASLRVKARVLGDKGAVAGFFTFYNDNNESDVEILTDDPVDMIRCVLHLSDPQTSCPSPALVLKPYLGVPERAYG